MPAKRELTMRQIRQMLRLHRDGVSAREIGRTLGAARSTVQDNLRRAAAAGLAWPLDAELTDDVLEQRLFARAGVRSGFRRRSEPDWVALARELKRPGVNLMVLWEEYRDGHPDGYGYSRFCDLFREFERRLSPVMRQHHAAGDKVFVDYSGKKIGIVDPETGVVRDAEIFVAVLGASNYTYAEACPSESLPDWIALHTNLFKFLGGVPKYVVCDNLKAAVTNPDRYDPGLNRTYAEMASHYGTAILAARPRRPKDKAKVEVAVQIAQRWVLARLRNHRFFSLAELNAAIRVLVVELNARQMRGFGSSRAELFAEIDKLNLAELPDQPYVFARWKRCRVAPDYHVEIDGHWYSTPYRLIRELVDVRIADKTVEIFHKGQRIASHARAPNRRGHTTIADHMPSAHRRYGKWTPGGLIAAGEKIGPSTAAFFQAVIAARPHPEQGFRTCLGILSLARSYDNARVDAACRRGILIKARSVASIRSILKNGLDRAFLDETPDHQPLRHGNIRGQGYFH